MYKVYLEIGHEAAIRTKRTPEGFTHDWEVFVRGCDNADIHYFVDKVVFHLHETFPKPKRVVKEPPYIVKETGYAGFTLPIEIYLRNREEPKKIQFQYDLNLQQTGPSIYKLQKEKFLFDNPNQEFRHKLLKGGAMLANPSTNIDASRDVHQNDDKTPLLSKPKLSAGLDTMKKHKSRQEVEAKVPNSFQDLFGTPITKTSKVSPEPKPINVKEVQKSSGINKGVEKNTDKVKTKHSPHKERDKEKNKDKDSSSSSSADKKNKEDKKNKDRSKERERSKEKKRDRSSSPKHSPKRVVLSPKRPPSPPPPPPKYKPEEKRSDSVGKEKKDALKTEKKLKKEKREKERKEHKTHKEKEPKQPKDKQKDGEAAPSGKAKDRSGNSKSPDRVKDVVKSEEKQKHKHKKKDKEKKEKRQENSHKADKKNEKNMANLVKQPTMEVKKEKDCFKENDKSGSSLFGSALKIEPRETKQSNPLNTLLAEIKDQDDSSNSSISSLDESSNDHSTKSIPSLPPPVVPDKKTLIKQEPMKEKELPQSKKNKDKRSDKDGLEKKKKRKSENKNLQDDEPLEKIQREGSDGEQKEPPERDIKKQDYMSILKELQLKIMALQDNAELQRVVQLIAETGQFEVTTRTFDFDLCRLDRNTIQRLQDFFAPT